MKSFTGFLCFDRKGVRFIYCLTKEIIIIKNVNSLFSIPFLPFSWLLFFILNYIFRNFFNFILVWWFFVMLKRSIKLFRLRQLLMNHVCDLLGFFEGIFGGWDGVLRFDSEGNFEWIWNSDLEKEFNLEINLKSLQSRLHRWRIFEVKEKQAQKAFTGLQA